MNKKNETFSLTDLLYDFRVTLLVFVQLSQQVSLVFSQSLQLLQQTRPLLLHVHRPTFDSRDRSNDPVCFAIDAFFFCVAAQQNILTVSCRPSLVFSTAFCSDSFRCLAWVLCRRKSMFHTWGYITASVASRTGEHGSHAFCQRTH